MGTQVQEAFITLNRHDQKRTSPNHSTVYLSKVQNIHERWWLTPNLNSLGTEIEKISV
jgi:hypothetical protein